MTSTSRPSVADAPQQAISPHDSVGEDDQIGGSQLDTGSMDDPNRPETEEDGIRAEALRRLKVRRQFGSFFTRTCDTPPQPQEQTESAAVSGEGNTEQASKTRD